MKLELLAILMPSILIFGYIFSQLVYLLSMDQYAGLTELN